MKTTAEIARENDLFRTTLISTPTKRLRLTDGITVLDRWKQQEIITQVREFKDFTLSNDPHLEHDFGGFNIGGVKYLWKIDYYDLNYEYGVDPHEDPYAILLTVMLAEEY